MLRKTSIQILFLIAISFSAFAQKEKANNNSNFTLAVNSMTGEMEMSKKELKAATLSISGGNDHDSKLTAFTLKVPGFPARVVAGDKIEPAAQLIDRVSVGDVIILYDAQINTKKKIKSHLLITIKE